MAEYRTLFRVLFETSRPAQLGLILGVYAFGVLIATGAGGSLALGEVFAGGAALLPVAASVHYANEYADYDTDRLTQRTPFSGGSGALHRTGLDRTVPLRAGIATLVLGVVLAVVLALVGPLSWTAVLLLAATAVVGWQYSVEPLKLAWRGWGELVNAVLGGLVLPVYGAAVAGGSLAVVSAASIPFCLVVLLNLFATQWPDREADGRVGKRTLAVRWSPSRLRRAYAGVAVLAGASLIALTGRVIPRSVTAFSLLVVPLVGYGAYGYTRRRVPWPTVTAMVGLLVLQTAGWLWYLR